MKYTNALAEEWAALVNVLSQYQSSTIPPTLSLDTKVSEAVNMINSDLQPPQLPPTFQVGSETMIPQVQAPVAYGPQDAQDQLLVLRGCTGASDIPEQIPLSFVCEAGPSGQRHGQDASDGTTIQEHLQPLLDVLKQAVNRENGRRDAETVNNQQQALSTTTNDSKRARISPPDTVVCRASANASHQQPMQVPNVMDYGVRMPQTGQLVYPTPSPSPPVPDRGQPFTVPFTFRPNLAPIINRDVKKLPAQGYKGPLSMPPAIAYGPLPSQSVAHGAPSLKRKRSMSSKNAHKYTPISEKRISCRFTTKAGHVCGVELVDNQAFVTEHCKEHENLDELPNIAKCPFCTPREHDSEGALEKSACSAFGRHIFLYHFYERTFVCPDCKEPCKRQDSLDRHRKTSCKGLAQ